MIDSLTSINHRDFRQRYQNTFGWFIKADGNRVFVHVTRVDDTAAYFSDNLGNKYHVYRDSGMQFMFIPVDHGWFNGKKHTFYLERVPARQWQRGISLANTRMWQSNLGWVDLTLGRLTELFVDPISVNEAYKQYMEGSRSCVALSKHFAFINKQVAFYLRRVGTLDAKRIALSSSLVKQELQDTINRTKLEYEIV